MNKFVPCAFLLASILSFAPGDAAAQTVNGDRIAPVAVQVTWSIAYPAGLPNQQLTVRTSGAWTLYRHAGSTHRLVRQGVLDVNARQTLIRSLETVDLTMAPKPVKSGCAGLPQAKVSVAIPLRSASVSWNGPCGKRPHASIAALEKRLSALVPGRTTIERAVGVAMPKKCELGQPLLYLSAALPETVRPGYPLEYLIIADTGAWVNHAGRTGCLGRKHLKKLRKHVATTRFGKSHHPSIKGCHQDRRDRHVVASPAGGLTSDWTGQCGGIAIDQSVRSLRLAAISLVTR